MGRRCVPEVRLVTVDIRVTVIVITLNRPAHVRRCLECLAKQTRQPEQVIVVDSSRDDITRVVVTDFPCVTYLRNETGFGRMTTSRNIGLLAAVGEIIAFLDDDAYAHPDWLAELLAAYMDDPAIGAVGGRALNGVPGEATYRADEVGQLKRTGELAGYFAADPGRVIDVDHVMGCNMSFRRTVLGQLGGFREDYPGISGVCEDTDMCVRVRALGFRIRFAPRAAVDHVGAPQAVGRRFDARYAYYGQRNYVALLVRNFGLGSGQLWGYLAHSTVRDGRRLGGSLWRAASHTWTTAAGIVADAAGTATGVVAGVRLRRRGGSAPVRTSPAGQKIAASLGGVVPAKSARPDHPSSPATCQWN
jgi:GT2 family glycosyltransferase